MKAGLTKTDRKRYGKLLREWRSDLGAILNGSYIPLPTHSHTYSGPKKNTCSPSQTLEILRLHKGGMSVREIADTLDLHLNTVRARVPSQ